MVEKTEKPTASAVVRTERDGDVAVIVIDNPPVNASSAAVRSGLLGAIDELSRAANVKAVVIIGAGTTFVSGSDIREFSGPLPPPQLPAVIEAIEKAPWPVVAAISGAALGGGYELALGCDGRIAAKNAVVGLPEVKLGIMPGAGGTQRLPRLIGIPKAIELITGGTRVPAPTAHALGMVDALSEKDLRADAVAYARSLAGKQRVASRDVPVADSAAVDKAASDARRRGKGVPAVDEAIASVERAAKLPIMEGLAAEREIFQRLRTSFEAAALRYQFFAEREAARLPALKDVAPRNVESVGIIGGGTMGSGIAVSFLDAGFPVVLMERDDAALAAGVERIRGLYERSLKSGRIDTAERDKRLARLTTTTSVDALASLDLVVEAVFEDMAVKRELFGKLDAVMKPGALLASNTSYLDLNEIAHTTKRPQDVVGLHFFSPANVMRLLEVVKADATAPEVLAAALKVGRRLGKIAVVAGVCDGFIGNRLYSAYRQQCEFMIEEGAWPEEVDAAMEAFGFAMGPFAVGDLSGLDIAWQRRKRLASTRDPKTRYVEIPDRLCEAGRLGQKTGAGYYRYPKPGVREVDPVTRDIIEAASKAKGITRRAFTREEIQRRALAALVNEAGLLLTEGIAQRASDIDVVLVNGYGFPGHRGGPLFWAAHQPRAEIEAAIGEIERAGGLGFRRAKVASVLETLKTN